ncbi:MAG: TetR/AcrR family transcriptional regulator [Deltaproteobacteria bacterium]|nr:TetR/AcrR family transcriptional regulator [Deltaproteobacteria bacterium]
MLAMENEALERRGEPPEASAPAIRSIERVLERRYAVCPDEVQRLLQAGLDEMRERQCVEPRVADIVRRAGLSNKAFYRHFRSRDELLLAILEQRLRVQFTKLEERMAQAGSALDRIRCWIWEILGRAVDPEAAAATRPLLVHQARLLESVGEEVWDCVERLKVPLRAAIAEAMKSGELEKVDVESDTEVVYQLAIGWMHGRLITPVPPTQQEAQRVVEFAIRGLERR